MSAPSRDTGARARAPALALAALLALVAALYARTFEHGFVAYDDPVYVSQNPVVAQGLTLAGLRWSFGFQQGNWHPLTWLSHMLDVELFGREAGAHHLVGAGLHVLNTALLAWLVLRLGAARWCALLVAALFALHPLRVESVAWASERKDVLAGTLWLLTLLAYERYARRGGAARFALVVLLFTLGLMAKSMLVTLPLVMLVLDAWPLGRSQRADARAGAGTPWRRLWLEKLPLVALALAVGSATLWIQRREGAVGTLGSLTLLERLANACLSYWIYAWKTVWPAGLACFVPHPVAVTPRAELARTLLVPGLLSALALVLVTIACVRVRRRRPHLLAGWLWYLIAAAPVIGFVQVGQQAYADRYTYLPTIGLVLAAVFELGTQVERRPLLRPAASALALLVLLALVPVTWRQLGTWRDSRTLFTHALAAVEDNYMAATFLGQVERRTGALALARAHLEFALAANKYHVPAMRELGLTLVELGDLPEARKALKRTLRNAPDDAEAQQALEALERRLGPGAHREGE